GSVVGRTESGRPRSVAVGAAGVGGGGDRGARARRRGGRPPASSSTTPRGRRGSVRSRQASGRDSGPDQRPAARRPIRVIRHTSRWWKGRIRLKYTRPAQFL